ncbi:hypothetical protein NFHSH190041_33670 [Shewanella sp. NFH-SH190041]|uniref:AAA family ATPase n=1 Tax=Shewanella sp. NFH-SH190041 TaxID=2950245 RepID=UPI0021C38AA9|nr:ATP-binding protein [Shewanella sp. NFH-SH190041]BDM65915.1 hypothetical protein NFHSH190041_33670 [Shewanella sp. NFH-SH190041]
MRSAQFTLLPSQQALLQRLQLLVSYSEQLQVLSAPAGAGKTTLVTELISSLSEYNAALVACPPYADAAEIRRKILLQLSASPLFDDEQPLSETLVLLQDQQAQPVHIVIDDAHRLPIAIWAECLVLSQLQCAGRHIALTFTLEPQFLSQLLAKLNVAQRRLLLTVTIPPLLPAERTLLYQRYATNIDAASAEASSSTGQPSGLDKAMTPADVIALLEPANHNDATAGFHGRSFRHWALGVAISLAGILWLGIKHNLVSYPHQTNNEMKLHSEGRGPIPAASLAVTNINHAAKDVAFTGSSIGNTVLVVSDEKQLLPPWYVESLGSYTRYSPFDKSDAAEPKIDAVDDKIPPFYIAKQGDKSLIDRQETSPTKQAFLPFVAPKSVADVWVTKVAISTATVQQDFAVIASESDEGKKLGINTAAMTSITAHGSLVHSAEYEDKLGETESSTALNSQQAASLTTATTSSVNSIIENAMDAVNKQVIGSAMKLTTKAIMPDISSTIVLNDGQTMNDQYGENNPAEPEVVTVAVESAPQNISKPTVGFAVQLASVSRESSIAAILHKLAAETDIRVLRYRQWWLILQGEYVTKREAENAAQLLGNKYKISAPVVRQWVKMQQYPLYQR